MTEHDFKSLSSLPSSNSKFDGFFKSQHHFAREVAEGFEYVRDMNNTSKNGFLPFETYLGEDIVQVTSKDGHFTSVTQVNNQGEAIRFSATLLNKEHKVNVKAYQISLTDNPDQTFTVDFIKTNVYDDKKQRITLGTQTYTEQGFVEGLKSVVLTDGQGNVESAQSIYEYQNAQGQICKEVLTAQDPSEITADPSKVVDYRLNLLSHTPTASYAVDDKKASCDQILDIMAQAQNSMLNLTSPEMIDMSVDFSLPEQ